MLVATYLEILFRASGEAFATGNQTPMLTDTPSNQSCVGRGGA
jgi:hypothetical protein